MISYQLRQREYLLQISRAMTSRLDLPSLLSLILTSAAEMVRAEAGLVALQRSSRSALVYQGQLWHPGILVAPFCPVVDRLPSHRR